MCYTLIQFECFQSFRYARRRSEVTVNYRLSAAAPISFSMIKVRRLLGRALISTAEGEYRENSEFGKKKGKYAHLQLLYEPGFESSRTLKL